MKREAKLEACRACTDALRRCFEDDSCGRALSLFARFSGSILRFYKRAEFGDAFGQFM